MSVMSINNQLIELFDERLPDGASRHIIFWYDPEQNFKEIIDDLALSDAGIKTKIVSNDYFSTKHLLEYEDKESNYLVYIPSEKPKDKDNWLLDILLYSREFRADWESLQLSKLGISNTDLKSVLKEFQPFFGSKQRKEALKSKISKNCNKKELLLGMLSVLAKTQLATTERIVRNVLSSGLDETNNAIYEQISKLMNTDIFWDIVKEEYGYAGKQELKYLFWSLNITAYITQLHDTKTPEDWKAYIAAKPHNCMVFIDNWRSHKNSSDMYTRLLDETEKELGVQQRMMDLDIENIIDADVFPSADREIIKHVTLLLTEDIHNTEKAQKILTRRNHPFWYSVRFKNYYQSLDYAIEFLLQIKKFEASANIGDPKALFTEYSNQYYKVDTSYRKYCLHFSRINKRKKFIFEDLDALIENTYIERYLKKLSIKWHELIKQDNSSEWPILGIKQQKQFYESFVDVDLQRSSREKVFVFISDAFRYEIAKDLEEELVQKRGEVSVDVMQASIPSYTQLGMASLLPNTSITFSEKGDVLVDGMSSKGSKNREKVLSKTTPESVVLKWNDLKNMSRTEARPLTNQKRVVYIYHNVIDAIGDDRKTEDSVIEAVEQAKEDIKTAIDFIINGLGGHKVIITSDHGFSYRRSDVADIEKLSLPEIEPLVSHRRFVISEQDSNPSSTLKLNLRYLGNQKLFTYFPNGHMIFSKQGGGEKFIHGGPLLQEVAIPVITYKNIRVSSAEQGQIPDHVDVLDSTANKIITNTVFRLHLFQKEPVGGKVLPRTLKIAMWDTSTDQKVSDEKTYTFDIESSRPEDREIDLTLHLKQANYDKNKRYELRLKNAESGITYNSIPYKINISFMSDFEL